MDIMRTKSALWRIADLMKLKRIGHFTIASASMIGLVNVGLPPQRS